MQLEILKTFLELGSFLGGNLVLAWGMRKLIPSLQKISLLRLFDYIAGVTAGIGLILLCFKLLKFL